MAPEKEALIPKHGGYRRLKSFQVAQLVYDVTVRFCDRYIEKRSRTHDQMVQAARSGVQNIAEGSQASGTSKKTELKLTNVARASLEELRLDYEDFLRQRGLPLWGREDPRRAALIARRCSTADDVAAWVKEQKDGPGQKQRQAQEANHGRGGRSGQKNGQDQDKKSGRQALSGQAPGQGSFTGGLPSTSSTRSTPSMLHPAFPEIAANAALVLINVACGLLDRQLASQAKAFEQEGGFTERLYRVRTARRKGTP